ncbi:MAG: phosphotransferase [Gammaproteobacteria bacterium]|nr:phosphotransferase [Gammaproteobacteria bacterium]
MTTRILAAARELWQLGAAPITLLADRENQVYRVDLADGPLALRLHRINYRSTDEIHSELLWMDMLARSDIRVPKPVPSLDGSMVRQIDGINVDLLGWIAGSPMSQIDPTEERYFELGSLMAKMHTLADAWSLPENFKRPEWDLVGPEPTWGRFWLNPELDALQRDKFAGFRQIATESLAALDSPDIGLIHADLVPDNVFCDGQLLHPIDFDDGGFGYRLFDLATVTHRSRRHPAGDAFARAAVAGYRKIRDLDLNSLKLFEALRACSYVGWNIARMNEPGAVERNTRFIREAEKAIDLYIKHSVD